MQSTTNINDPKFQEILEKTSELFLEFGIRNLNMDDISRNMGISKKTLYLYVKSKEDLIEKLFLFDQLKWDKKMNLIMEKKLNAIEILFQVSLMVFEEMGRFDPKLTFELKKYYEPIFQDFMVRKQNHTFTQISKNMRRGIAEGLYRKDINVDLVAGLYVRNLVMMHNKDFCIAEDITLDQLIEVMFENHIRAIATPEGIAYFEMRKAEIKNSNNKL